MDELQRQKRARTILLMHYPFFGYLAAKLQFKETDKVPTMATDGRHLFFNPKFTEKLSNNQTVTGVAHEVMHCASRHTERRGGRQHGRWNRAGDFAINLLLKKSGLADLVVPGEFEWLCDPKYEGMVAEQIYDLLPEDAEGGGCVILDSPGQGGEGKQDPPLDGTGDSGAEAPESPPPVDWKRAVVEAANFARMRGPLPAGIEDMVDDIVRPPIDVRRFVRSEMTTSCKRNDWTYRRPNRRYAHTGIIIASPFGYTTKAEVHLDSSGSISSDLWSYALGVTVEVATQLKVPLTVVVADAAVQETVENVRSVSDVKHRVHFKGRGGTDFRPSLEEAARRKPSIVFYVTDGYGAFPEQKPRFKVVWILAPGTPEDLRVPFGQKLVLPADVLKRATV